MKTLYQLDDELDAIAATLHDAEGEVDDETSARFDALLDAREDKADAYIALIKNAEAEAKLFDEEIRRLTTRRGVASNMAADLKTRLLFSMERRGETEIKGRLGKVRRQRTASTSVDVLADPADLPERFQRVRVEADKTALKAALAEMDPDAVRVAQIVESESYHVRIY